MTRKRASNQQDSITRATASRGGAAAGASGGDRKPNGQCDVAMIQSLVRKEEVDDLVADYEHVIVDECHHLPAGSFERVLSEVNARYLVGLTATPQRRDGRHPITAMQLGPVRFRVDAKSQAALRPFDHKLIFRETGFQVSGDHSNLGIQEIYRELANDETRNTASLMMSSRPFRRAARPSSSPSGQITSITWQNSSVGSYATSSCYRAG